MSAVYPKRDKLFALHFSRYMHASRLANRIGADACWLLQVIVNTEDSCFYRPVGFFNEQLLPFVGCANVKALDRVRRRAVDAGWLHYEPGCYRSEGVYWVIVPIDELDAFAACSWTKSTTTTGGRREDDGHDGGRTTGTTAGGQPESEGQTWTKSTTTAGGRREDDGQPPTPTLFLTQEQYTPLPPAEPVGVCVQAAEDSSTPEVGPNPDTVKAHWNTFPGLIPSVAQDCNVDQIIRSWAITRPDWVKHWRAAITYLGTTPFYCGAGKAGWRADLSWLLRDSNFPGIVNKMSAGPAPDTTATSDGFNPIPMFGRQPPRDTHAAARTDIDRAGHRVLAAQGKYTAPDNEFGVQTRRSPPADPCAPGSPA